MMGGRQDKTRVLRDRDHGHRPPQQLDDNSFPRRKFSSSYDHRKENLIYYKKPFIIFAEISRSSPLYYAYYLLPLLSEKQ